MVCRCLPSVWCALSSRPSQSSENIRFGTADFATLSQQRDTSYPRPLFLHERSSNTNWAIIIILAVLQKEKVNLYHEIKAHLFSVKKEFFNVQTSSQAPHKDMVLPPIRLKMGALEVSPSSWTSQCPQRVAARTDWAIEIGQDWKGRGGRAIKGLRLVHRGAHTIVMTTISSNIKSCSWAVFGLGARRQQPQNRPVKSPRLPQTIFSCPHLSF